MNQDEVLICLSGFLLLFFSCILKYICSYFVSKDRLLLFVRATALLVVVFLFCFFVVTGASPNGPCSCWGECCYIPLRRIWDK